MMNISTFINMASKIPSPGQLEGLVTFMKEDEKLRFFTESYRKTGDKSYKHDAPLFAVACIFEGGKGKDNIRSLTHLSLVDFDHITEKPDDGTLRSLKERICHDAHTLLCYVTMSGNGLRVIYRYEAMIIPPPSPWETTTTRISSARKAIRSARTSQGSADSPTTPKSISILKPQPSRRGNQPFPFRYAQDRPEEKETGTHRRLLRADRQTQAGKRKDQVRTRQPQPVCDAGGLHDG
ncbi:hypothetical protein DXA63_16610 [Segatella copri]|uniref:BT4734-like N-terminal domain-containing protein n=1 Tax=Segatella copri TaxID=165179 RepID=A0AA92ULR9_9BACT|nr:hypothetical protein DXA63_16610 [Segatella copri]